MAEKTTGISQKWARYALLSILLVAALLRLINLSSGDTLNDEIGYAFRAVGMLDFDEAAKQTTPLEWFDPSIRSGETPMPWWIKLSFHDHPPLVFYIQHIFMNVFGETNFGFRFPSALFGIACVYLLYRIGTVLFSRNAGLIAAAILAVTVNHVFVSRLGLQEVYVIFFILLTILLFLKAKENDWYYLAAGAALGLGLLAKYTVLVIALIFGTYLLFTEPRKFLNKKLWAGLGLSLLIFSPILIYNYQLYKAVGHFDFQLSHIFKQNPKEWQVMPGKEIGSLGDRARAFFPNLFDSHSWMLFSLWILSMAGFAIALFRNFKTVFRTYFFLIASFFFLVLLVAFIGPARRFLTPFTPFIALSVACLFENIRQRWFTEARQKIFYAAMGIFFALETLYSINSTLTNYPAGSKPWAWSSVREENWNWGYNELIPYLERELRGKMPAFAFESKFTFIERIQKKSLAAQEREGRKPYAALIIYDANIFNIPQLWILDRLQVYHGWPIVPTETYAEVIRVQGADHFAKLGVEAIYFISPTENLSLDTPDIRTVYGPSFEKQLINKKITPVVLKNKRGEEVFKIYKF